MKFSIDAVHSIFQRVVKFNLSYDEFNNLQELLVKNGYEKMNMKLETFYEEGDTITITEEMFNKMKDSDQAVLLHIFVDPSFPISGKVIAQRLDNQSGHLNIEWNNVEDHYLLKKTNTYFLKDIIKFKEYEFPTIPIIECDDCYLDAEEIVVKHMILNLKWTEAEVWNYLKPVNEAMNKANAVFYQP